MREVFKPVAFQQHNKRPIPKVSATTKQELAGLKDFYLANGTKIPSWADLTTTHPPPLRQNYFPTNYRDERENVTENDSGEDIEEAFCPSAIFVILIIISSCGILFVLILAMLPNKC